MARNSTPIPKNPSWENRASHGMSGLKNYYRTNGGVRFASLPPELRPEAEQQLAAKLKRYPQPVKPTLLGALMGNITTHLLYEHGTRRAWAMKTAPQRKKAYLTMAMRRAAKEAALAKT